MWTFALAACCRTAKSGRLKRLAAGNRYCLDRLLVVFLAFRLATHLLAPIVLPFQITVLVFVVALVAIGVFFRRKTAFAIALMFSFILFIPSCIGIAFIVDAVRYGHFEYATAVEISDPYVDVPKNARSVTLYKYSSGHEIRFASEKEELEKWMEAVDNRRKDFMAYKPFTRDNAIVENEGRKQSFESLFGRRGWSMPDDVVRYSGWRSARGSGFDVWYSPSTRTGFIHAGYW